MNTIKFNCVQNDHLLTDEIKQMLFNKNYYWSDTRGVHWMFDFKVNGLWIENITLSNDLKTINFMITAEVNE